MRTQFLFFWLALARIIATLLANAFQAAIVGYAVYRNREVNALFKTHFASFSVEMTDRISRDDKKLK
jgi:hypothetical protein